MNSRTFTVPRGDGTDRPMFMGMWKDEFGIVHRKGMADLLLTPQVPALKLQPPTALVHIPMNHNTTGGLPVEAKITVVLWVECKSGEGVLSKDQREFRDDVRKAGAYYIEAHDDANDVVAWFEKMGVRR